MVDRVRKVLGFQTHGVVASVRSVGWVCRITLARGGRGGGQVVNFAARLVTLGGRRFQAETCSIGNIERSTLC